jgi:hypothetical protein
MWDGRSVTNYFLIENRKDAPMAAALTGKFLTSDGCTAAGDRVPFRAGDERPGGESDGGMRPGEHVGTDEHELDLGP